MAYVQYVIRRCLELVDTNLYPFEIRCDKNGCEIMEGYSQGETRQWADGKYVHLVHTIDHCTGTFSGCKILRSYRDGKLITWELKRN